MACDLFSITHLRLSGRATSSSKYPNYAKYKVYYDIRRRHTYTVRTAPRDPARTVQIIIYIVRGYRSNWWAPLRGRDRIFGRGWGGRGRGRGRRRREREQKRARAPLKASSVQNALGLGVRTDIFLSRYIDTSTLNCSCWLGQLLFFFFTIDTV